MTLRFEGVRFSDGSCAVRRVAADPCDRATLTFESVRELEEDVGSADVSWLGDSFLPRQSPMCDRCGLRRARCGTLGKPGEYCSLACLQAAEAEEAAKSKAVFTLPVRVLNGWQLHDIETGQELRPGLAIVDLQPGEEPVPPPCCAMCRGPLPEPTQVYSLARPNAVGLLFCRKSCARVWQDENPSPPVADVTTSVNVAKRISTIVGDPPRPAYVGDGHPAVRGARYEPTEEIDEP